MTEIPSGYTALTSTRSLNRNGAPYFSFERIKRRAKFAGGKRMEAGYRRTELGARVADKPLKGRSEKSRSAWRNDPIRDEKIFMFINASLRSRQPVRVTAASAHVVWAARKNLREAERASRKIIPEVGLPHWDHASEILKMLGWGMASRELGATPFTLRLSEDVIQKARACRRGFGWYVQDRLSRYLRPVMEDEPPAVWFAVEQGLGDEPHLHGAVVIPPDRRQQVLDALRAAGGRWRNPIRQCHFGRANNLVKWTGYCTKWLWRSKSVIGNGAVVGATNVVRRTARACYQGARSRSAVIYP